VDSRNSVYVSKRVLRVNFSAVKPLLGSAASSARAMMMPKRKPLAPSSQDGSFVDLVGKAAAQNWLMRELTFVVIK